ncbi:MAG: class I SAM-dependent methyltransferase [Patescibacteria group bacterium]|jgi:hypothetical protein|nr:class I SAM-dependent methyltransferase [Patescibacteria group bacterium]
MDKEFKVQVSSDHYQKTNYDSLTRFISYFTQIDIVRSLQPKKVLEIGVGNKTVSNYLNNNGIKVDTCDFDKELEPDYVADIRDLPMEDNSYDAVMACEIIEHIPWDDVEKALKELHRVSKKHVIISIPYAAFTFEIITRFPFTKTLFNKLFVSCFLRIPRFFIKLQFNGEHYWEMGMKGYPRKKIREEFKKYFEIKKEVRPVLDHYHYFFVLEKK